MWIIKRKDTGEVAGTTDAPKDTDPAFIARCYNGTVGAREDADIFEAELLPNTQWSSLSQMWTPMTERKPVNPGEELVVVLADHSDREEKREPIPIYMDRSDSSRHVHFRAEGYGEASSEDGHGFIIGLEHYDGNLRLMVWLNINEQDPVVLTLEQARETNRTPE